MAPCAWLDIHITRNHLNQYPFQKDTLKHGGSEHRRCPHPHLFTGNDSIERKSNSHLCRFIAYFQNRVRKEVDRTGYRAGVNHKVTASAEFERGWPDDDQSSMLTGSSIYRLRRCQRATTCLLHGIQSSSDNRLPRHHYVPKVSPHR